MGYIYILWSSFNQRDLDLASGKKMLYWKLGYDIYTIIYVVAFCDIYFFFHMIISFVREVLRGQLYRMRTLRCHNVKFFITCLFEIQ